MAHNESTLAQRKSNNNNGNVKKEEKPLHKETRKDDNQENNEISMPGKKFGLHRDEILPQFRIPFIMTGYRRPNLKVIECMHSAFIPTCNEALNFWSHFIALGLFILKFYELFTTTYSIYDQSKWPLLSSGVGICGFCLASSTAHMFNSMSPAAQHSCFFMDYAAIAIYSVCAGQGFFYYGRPLNPTLWIFRSEWTFIIASTLTSICTTLLCCTTRFRWHKYKYTIRTMSFVAPFIVNASPYMYRMLFCSHDSLDAISTVSFRAFQIHVFFYLSSAIVNMLRFPERVFPGKFDMFGHSHHFLHVFTAIGASYQFDAIHLDMIARKDQLMAHPIQGSINNSLLPLVFSIAVNIIIALCFGKNSDQIAKNYKLKKDTK
eukprot:gene20424-22437_t